MTARAQTQTFLFIALFTLLAVVLYGISENFGGCGTKLFCFRRLMTSSPYQYYFLPTLSIFFSLLPLLFLKDVAYFAWRKFAFFGILIMLFLIAVTPEHDTSSGMVSLTSDREVISLTLSSLFLLISWIFIGYKALSRRFK